MQGKLKIPCFLDNSRKLTTKNGIVGGEKKWEEERTEDWFS